MKIYRKGELRDIIIAFCVFGVTLTIATLLKNKQTVNTLNTKNSPVNLTVVRQQGKVLE